MRLALAFAALLLACPGVQAFASIQRGDSPHDEVTGVAATEAGWPKDAVEALQAAVRQPDIDDLQPVEGEDGKKRMDASVTYAPWHHCARQPPGGDASALNDTVAYIHAQRALAHNLSLLDPPAAVRALGRALHALQDCFSHSNVVDLDAQAAALLQEALVHGGEPPEGLRLCGVLPHSSDIERPPGDAYSHADFNKDDAKASPEAEIPLADGRSKYEHAHALATEATRAFLVDFMQGLGTDESDRLLTARIEKEGKGALGIPAVGIALLPILAVAAMVCRHRP
jgi:hypothetical protein